jgi:hypothetical protein
MKNRKLLKFQYMKTNFRSFFFPKKMKTELFFSIRKKISLTLFLMGLALVAKPQSDQWWNDIHGWGPGMPGWRSFMIISPGYLGINALPIPTQLKGQINLKPELEIATDLHFLDGEKAQNIFIRYCHSFANGRIAVEIWGIPTEHSKYSEKIRDERKSRIKSGEEWETGDLYFSTNIKLIDERQWPSVVLRMACKTASGELYGARFTDTPGYWFDLSAGKTFRFIDRIAVRPFAMYGFYAWQTTSTQLLQNDAKIWGGGIEATFSKFRIEQSVQGYKGWRQEKDRPINYRCIVGVPVWKNELKFEVQHGIQDVLYKSVRVAWVFKF